VSYETIAVTEADDRVEVRLDRPAVRSAVRQRADHR